ncbi:BnaC08g14890D [Brassica napus]|uniref:BnaC08g14890D protein n=1 Tax=Brassica napus TaxID=3708 RepID=A0A078IH17_BRANA|nr:BnaC08g14890D [Brassica napus]
MQSPVTNEDAIVAVAAVEDTVPGGDSQPAVAVDSSDLGTVSPAPVPFVPTLGAWAKPLKLSPSALSVQRKFGSNLLQDLSYPTSHWPSLPSGQREGHTKNMATPVPNKGPMVTVAGGDSQPVVAVDSPDLRSTVFSPVSPASVPLVRTYSRSLGKTPEDPSAFFFFWVGRTMGRWFEPTPRSVRHVPVAIFLFRISYVILLQALESKADVTVSKDGSGKFTTVKEAVASAPENSKTRYTILVKRGTYLENVIIGKNKTNLTILGEGSNLTTITGSWNHVDGKGTYDSATLAVDGEGFMAGPTKELWLSESVPIRR